MIFFRLFSRSFSPLLASDGACPPRKRSAGGVWTNLVIVKTLRTRVFHSLFERVSCEKKVYFWD